MTKPILFVDLNSERFAQYSDKDREELALTFDHLTPEFMVEIVNSNDWISVDLLKPVLEIGASFEFIPDFLGIAQMRNLSLFDTKPYIHHKKSNTDEDVIISNKHGYYIVGQKVASANSPYKFRIPYTLLKAKDTVKVEESVKFIALPTNVDMVNIQTILQMEPEDVRFIIVDVDNTRFYHIMKITGYLDSMNGARTVLGLYHNRMVSRRVFRNHNDAFEYAKSLSGQAPVPHKEYMVTLTNKILD